MKKFFLMMPLLILASTGMNAGELPKGKVKTVTESKKSPVTAEELQAKIDRFNKYLTNLPIEIQQTIGELKDFKARGTRATNMVKNLLVTLDTCANKELDQVSEEMCETLSETSVGSLIRDKKKEVEQAITFVANRLKELKTKEGNSELIQNGIRSLENARDILLGKI